MNTIFYQTTTIDNVQAHLIFVLTRILSLLASRLARVSQPAIVTQASCAEQRGWLSRSGHCTPPSDVHAKRSSEHQTVLRVSYHRDNGVLRLSSLRSPPSRAGSVPGLSRGPACRTAPLE